MTSTSLAGRTILVAEDEPLIAMEIVTALEKVGAVTVTAATCQRARELVEVDGLSAAVVDFGLHDGDADGLCTRLNERDIPYVLHSGYTRSNGYTHFNDACRRGAVVPKPASPTTLIDALVSLLGGGSDKGSPGQD